MELNNMAITSAEILQKLTQKFGEDAIHSYESYGMFTFETDKDINLKVLQFLYEEPSLNFQFLTDLCGIHYPDNTGKEIGVVYHLHNLVENIRIRYKVFAPKDAPNIFTASKLFSAANWMERETYDFYGVNFIGHPKLKRILNVDEMDYFPLRKEYPLEDQTRIDKDDEMFGRG